MDYDKWGFWFGIAFFLLSVPVSFAINVWTPRLLNWWASRSLLAGAKRAKELEATIHYLAQLDPTADFQSRLLRAVYWLSSMILAAGALAVFGRLDASTGKLGITTLVVVGFLAMAGGRVTSMVSHAVVLRLPRLREELDDVRASLAERESRNSPEGEGGAKVFPPTITKR